MPPFAKAWIGRVIRMSMVYRVGRFGSGSIMAEQRRRVAEFKKFALVVREANAIADRQDAVRARQSGSGSRFSGQSGDGHLQEAYPNGPYCE